jgi:hypothetical protein
MCVLFSLSGLLWSVASIYWNDHIINLWMQAQSCTLYTVGHWIFCFHYYTVATSAKFIVENGPEAHLSNFKRGWFSFVAICVQVFLVESATFYEYFYDTETEWEIVMVLILNIIQTIMFVYALLQIRALLNTYPELKEGNKMMSLHLVIFNVFLLFSFAYVLIVIYLFNTNTRSANITCQIVADARAISYFSVFMFITYLMTRFSHPPKEKVLPRMIALR